MSDAPVLIDTDVHNHIGSLTPYLPKAWHDRYRDVGLPYGAQYYSSIGTHRKDANPDRGGPPGSDPQFLISDHMDRYGVDYAILTGSGVLGLSLDPDPDYGNVLAAACNDRMVDTWLSVSPRFKGSIFVNASDPVEAAAEIRRHASNPDMVQVLMASAARMPYGQRFYHPIYDAAQECGLPVAVHPGTEGKGISGPPTPSGYPTRYMEWHNILPTNYMTHVNSLVCEGVFEKFPKLKFVAIEGGISWLPHLMWRMDKNYKALRESAPWLKRFPSEYIVDHIRLTTQPIEEPNTPEQFVQILHMISAEKTVMFSSDYPHWDNDNPRMTLPRMPKEMKKRILAGTAAELYGLHTKPAGMNSISTELAEKIAVESMNSPDHVWGEEE
ncbi:amidohydrolase family protein [Paenibacillus eucommiae]|uniref:TIM-barrel fold metal-dependent hydrolase n=1 Tax=Paenibacillus eucommiae TaxID=1355755 RepID=A0ABS4IMF9_9BACL|nr:amidohydrolase family protein [Paenibacillus eucommiae]MBP1988700.1 putative TIM-barrel fold metal-dependent hydrolase [Paenibacillus eucommiae]